MSGYEVLRSLRVAKVKTPILILSGMAGIEDKETSTVFWSRFTIRSPVVMTDCAWPFDRRTIA
jgi:CheY-like chemotaxis protein